MKPNSKKPDEETKHGNELKPVLPESVWRCLSPKEQHHIEIDKYDYFPRSIALSRFISTSKTPQTVCVFAEWGRGKTTIIKTVEYILCQNAIPDNWDHVKILRYNPWAFKLESFEDVWFSIIEELRAQLKNENDEKKGKGSSEWGKKELSNFIDTSLKAQILRGIQYLGSATRIIPGFDKGGKAVEDILNNLSLKDPQPAYGFFTANRTALQGLFSSLPPQWRVLLIVDDIDRCEPEIQVEILRAIHVFARSKMRWCGFAGHKTLLNLCTDEKARSTTQESSAASI